MNKTPLYVPPVSINTEDPAFHGDLFNRENLAKRLTDCIDRLPSGGVIAIDAPWGEGKSWFGQHWHNKLKADGYRTAFINAFERDYVEEPFVMLVSELLTSLAGTEKSKLKKTGIAVAKALAPLAAKSAINAVAHLLTGTTDFSEKIDGQIENAGDAIAAGAEKLLSKQIEDYEKSKVAVDGFRRTLGEIATTHEKPLVIFVDELDRCRPEFAVRLIERVKHLFEMPKIVFVLLLNHDQLGKAIKGVYGSEIDANKYLAKFFHLTLSLPTKPHDEHGQGHISKFCYSCLNSYGLTPDEHWVSTVSEASSVLSLSLRDVERCVGLFSLVREDISIFWFHAWPMIVKTVKPQLFAGVVKDVPAAHEELIELIQQIRGIHSENYDSVWGIYYDLHVAAKNKSNLEPNSETLNWLSSVRIRPHGDRKIGGLLSQIFRAVDIRIK